MMPGAQSSALKIAIIGGGPAGLGSAIALSALENVEVKIYEKASELREIGAGIRIGFNCWKVLELLGAADDVKGSAKAPVLHRNGLTGEVLKRSPPSTAPPKYQPQRVRRTRLQQALVSHVPDGIIQLYRRLLSLKDMDDGTVRLYFEGGAEELVDLVVGGDGIRSIVRSHVFPSHRIKFTGTTIFRVLVPTTLISHIPDMSAAKTWWHGPDGYFYGSPVDDPTETPEQERMFEIAARKTVDPATDTGERFSWGIPVTNQKVALLFSEYDLRIREALNRVPEGEWREFSQFAGPRLEKLTAWDGKVVLIGDASHPLSGAFGSGAAFALEDGWILARAIEYTGSARGGLKNALDIFDAVRSPYYARMYQYLDQQKKRVEESKKTPNHTFEDSLQARVNSIGREDLLPWVYENDIAEVWRKFVENDAGTFR